jgi:hypothetical protein
LSTDEWIKIEEYTYNIMLFSLLKEGNSVPGYNMDEP